MTPLTKTFLGFMAVAIVVAGTLALRSRQTTASAPAQLTPAQAAEIHPLSTPEPPKAVSSVTSRPADDSDLPPPPEEPDLEDGSGS